MRRRAIAGLTLLASVAVLFAAVVGASSWLVYTEAGLQWLSARVVGYAGKGLTLDGVAGTLAQGAHVQHIRYAGKDIEVRVESASLSVSPLSLFSLSPRINDLTAAQLSVTSKPTEPRGKPPDTLKLPIDFELRRAHVQRLVIDLGKGPMDIENVRLDYAGGESMHRIEALSLSVMGMAVALRGRIDAQPPFALQASFTAEKSQSPPATVNGDASGNLSVINIDGGARSGEARATAKALVHPYDAQPLVKVSAKLAAFDLQAFVATLPHTQLNGDIELARSGVLFAGPISLTNALPGPYDEKRIPLTALQARIATDLKRGTFTEVTATLGAAGVITGSGQLTQNAAQLQLTLRNLNLAGLYSTLHATRLAGRAQIVLEEKRQSLNAELKQQDITLNLSATRTGDAIDIRRFEAQARGGSARGSGQLSIAQPQPFSVHATFSRFNPAAWGALPRGAINGELAARGRIAGPAADLNFSIRDSRWLNAPLAGNGKLSVTRERVHTAALDVTLGGNRIVAQGALGMPRDTLDVRFDAPRLALIDPAMTGRLRGTAQVSGTYRAPRVQFDASGDGLSHQAYGAVRAITARGMVDLQPTGPIDVNVQASGIRAPQGELAFAAVRVEGTRTAHTALVEARGERIDFRARARGGWYEQRGWGGTLAELVNRGELPVEITAPVDIAVGPNRVRVAPVTLRAMGGELAISELAYEQGRLSTAGRLRSLP
ncbi:MAG: hypothetical protein V4637_17885, partial [Pseudomonadota bacterium]